MLNKENGFLKNAIKRSVKSMIQQESDDWPPKCSIILYQPHRPKKIDSATGKKIAK